MLWFVTVHCERLPSTEQLVIFLHRKFPDILNNHQKAVLTEKNEKVHSRDEQLTAGRKRWTIYRQYNHLISLSVGMFDPINRTQN